MPKGVGVRSDDVTGRRWGMLTAVCPYEMSDQGAVWLFACDCGKESLIRLKDVRHGNTRSCGCMQWKHNAIPGARPWLGRRRMMVDGRLTCIR